MEMVVTEIAKEDGDIDTFQVIFRGFVFLVSAPIIMGQGASVRHQYCRIITVISKMIVQ